MPSSGGLILLRAQDTSWFSDRCPTRADGRMAGPLDQYSRCCQLVYLFRGWLALLASACAIHFKGGRWAEKYFLQAAIVLMGLQISLDQIKQM